MKPTMLATTVLVSLKEQAEDTGLKCPLEVGRRVLHTLTECIGGAPPLESRAKNVVTGNRLAQPSFQE